MIIKEATCYGVKNKEGKWQFYPDGSAELDYDIALFQSATMIGCKFCGLTPLIAPFIYSDSLEHAYCNVHCLKAATGICNCKAEAQWKIYFIANEIDYIIHCTGSECAVFFDY